MVSASTSLSLKNRLAHESAVGAPHSRPDDCRLLAADELQMSDGRFRIIMGLEDRARFRVDQRDRGALAEGRGNLELHFSATREL